jgi:F-type H+-transporting ATPase subunit b
MKKAIITIIILSIPHIAYAVGAGKEAEPATPADWLFRIINFSLLVGILIYFVGGILKSSLAARKDEVERLVKEAEETAKEAKKRLAEIEERVRKREEEVRAIIEDAKKRGENEKTLLIEEGNKVRERLERHAKVRIEQELKKAKEALHIEAVTLTMEFAEKKIKKDFTNKDQDNLIEEYLIKIMEKKG